MDEEILSELQRLNTNVEQLTVTVREERKGRLASDRAYRASRRAMVIASGFILIAASLAVNWFIQDRNDEKQRAQDKIDATEAAAKQDCDSRIQARKDIRAMSVALADETAIVLEASEELRVRIHNRAVAITEEVLPPPDC